MHDPLTIEGIIRHRTRRLPDGQADITSQSLEGVGIMKRMLMAILAVAVAVTFSAPAYAGEEKKEKKDEKKGK